MYQVEIDILIQHKILLTNLQRNLQQLEVRTYNQILGVQGLLVFDISRQVKNLKKMTTLLSL